MPALVYEMLPGVTGVTGVRADGVVWRLEVTLSAVYIPETNLSAAVRLATLCPFDCISVCMSLVIPVYE